MVLIALCIHALIGKGRIMKSHRRNIEPSRQADADIVTGGLPDKKAYTREAGSV
jgi:hypothetical protein